jgi:lipid-binding SYLF domain-containing protein
MKIHSILGLVPGIVLSMASAGCSSYREGGGEVNSGDMVATEAKATIKRFRESDPSMEKFFKSSHGYAVYPKVSKGGAGIGAAHGNGVVYERGDLIGDSELTQVSLGVQLGGQTYSEIVFFETKAVLDVFKKGNLEFSAQASAIAAESGAGAANDFEDGVAVFTLPRGGLMFEAAIGGQQFSFRPR